MKIPPGTQGGQRFRLRDRGLPSSTGTRGDLYVVTQIQIPKKIRKRNGRSGPTWQSCMEVKNRANKMMKISLGTDHAGFRYKEKVKELLVSLGHEVKDFGTLSEEAGRLSAFHSAGGGSGGAAASAIAELFLAVPATAKRWRRTKCAGFVARFAGTKKAQAFAPAQ